DVGVDHRVAADAQREDVLAAPGQRRRRDGHLALAVLLRQERRARGDAAEDRHLTVGSHGGIGEGERSRRAAGARPSMQLTLALERSQVIERRPGRDPESLADLAHGRRYSVLGLEAPHEAEYLLLPVRQLAHARPPVKGHITQLMLTSQQKTSGRAGPPYLVAQDLVAQAGSQGSQTGHIRWPW